MRICNFNASANPAKLPNRSRQPQPFVPIRSIAVLPPSFAFTSSSQVSVFSSSPAASPSPSPPHRSFLFSTVASIAESHNAWSKLFCATTQSTYSNASRSPPARSNRFRPCVVFGLLFPDFFFVFHFFFFSSFLRSPNAALLIGPLATVDTDRIKWRSSPTKYR